MSSFERLARPSSLPKPSASTMIERKPQSLNSRPQSTKQQEDTEQQASNHQGDRRLQLIGSRKSGYSGHVPKCVFYDRERIPAPIHMGGVIPSRGRLQLDGSYMPTQSMVKERERALRDTAAKPVASVNEIGLRASETRGPADKGGAPSKAGDSEGSAILSRPFTRQPEGRLGQYSDLERLSRSKGHGVEHGSEFTSTISPPRSPTARYYLNVGKGVGSDQIYRARQRQVGAGGVVCGQTPLQQYGSYLHHNDATIHGVEKHLLPQIYGALDPSRPLSPRNMRNDFNGSLRSNTVSQAEGVAAATGRDEGRSRDSLTPFPRYPVLRGPNRMGPRGLESFLTN